jgi:hypothetical protein
MVSYLNLTTGPNVESKLNVPQTGVETESEGNFVSFLYQENY